MEWTPESFGVERFSPQLGFTIKGEHLILTYINAGVYVFPEQFERFDHVYVEEADQEEGHGKYIFACTALMDTLSEEGFPTYSLPFPSENDIEAYAKCMNQNPEWAAEQETKFREKEVALKMGELAVNIDDEIADWQKQNP